MRKTFSNLFAQYGIIAVVIYFTIFFLTWFGVWVALKTGWKPNGMTSQTGLFVASYLLTKVTQPIRILATVALTPLVARAVGKTPVQPPQRPDDATT